LAGLQNLTASKGPNPRGQTRGAKPRGIAPKWIAAKGIAPGVLPRPARASWSVTACPSWPCEIRRGPSGGDGATGAGGSGNRPRPAALARNDVLGGSWDKIYRGRFFINLFFASPASNRPVNRPAPQPSPANQPPASQPDALPASQIAAQPSAVGPGRADPATLPPPRAGRGPAGAPERRPKPARSRSFFFLTTAPKGSKYLSR
jgi:hypothetical protein